MLLIGRKFVNKYGEHPFHELHIRAKSVIISFIYGDNGNFIKQVMGYDSYNPDYP